MYKIVDSFNGFEDERRFEDLAEAENALEKAYAAFHRANRGGAICCLTIEDADATWYHHPQMGWIWE